MFNVKFLTKIDNEIEIYCPKRHRYPEHLAALLVIDNGKIYFCNGGDDIELNLEEMKEMVKIMEEIEKDTK